MLQGTGLRAVLNRKVSTFNKSEFHVENHGNGEVSVTIGRCTQKGLGLFPNSNYITWG